MNEEMKKGAYWSTLLFSSLPEYSQESHLLMDLSSQIPGEQASQPLVMELLAQEATTPPCKITVYSSQIN